MMYSWVARLLHVSELLCYIYMLWSGRIGDCKIFNEIPSEFPVNRYQRCVSVCVYVCLCVCARLFDTHLDTASQAPHHGKIYFSVL
jgi:hypothetical protein